MSPGTVSMRLGTRAPFDGRGLLRFLSDHAIRGVEHGDDERFARAVRLPHGRAELELRLDGPAGVLLTARLDDDDRPELVARVRRLLDLDADSAAIDAALARDGTLAPLVTARPGIRLPGSIDAEEALFRTLVGQQISVAAARTVLGRITAELSDDPALFPTALRIAEHGAEVLRGPATRVASIVGAARAIAGGDLTLDPDMPVDELTARLTALPGVGPWTAGYVAMRVLGSGDILLTTDLALLAGATRLGLPATARGLAAHGMRWAPWRSYASMHLWRARA